MHVAGVHRQQSRTPCPSAGYPANVTTLPVNLGPWLGATVINSVHTHTNTQITHNMLLRGERRLSALILLGLCRRLSALSFFFFFLLFFSSFFPSNFFGASWHPSLLQPGAFRRTGSGTPRISARRLSAHKLRPPGRRSRKPSLMRDVPDGGVGLV